MLAGHGVHFDVRELALDFRSKCHGARSDLPRDESDELEGREELEDEAYGAVRVRSTRSRKDERAW